MAELGERVRVPPGDTFQRVPPGEVDLRPLPLPEPFELEREEIRTERKDGLRCQDFTEALLDRWPGFGFEVVRVALLGVWEAPRRELPRC